MIIGLLYFTKPIYSTFFTRLETKEQSEIRQEINNKMGQATTTPILGDVSNASAVEIIEITPTIEMITNTPDLKNYPTAIISEFTVTPSVTPLGNNIITQTPGVLGRLGTESYQASSTPGINNKSGGRSDAKGWDMINNVPYKGRICEKIDSNMSIGDCDMIITEIIKITKTPSPTFVITVVPGIILFLPMVGG